MLIFSCDKASLFPPVHFLRMWLSCIITIKNSNGDSTSPWNIPLQIFTSANLFPPIVDLLWFSRWTLWLCWISFIFWVSLLFCFAVPYTMPFCYLSMTLLNFCVSFFSPWGYVDQCIVYLPFVLILYGIFIFRGIVHELLANCKSI